MADAMFTVIKSSNTFVGPRIGRLALPGKPVIDTPHYLSVTSRGTVPHITQDVFRRDTAIAGMYVALEDFIEKAPEETPPIYQFKTQDNSAPLRSFLAVPDDTLLVLGPKRTPSVIAPDANSNTDAGIAAGTAFGFRSLRADVYSENVERLRPDIVVALADVAYGRAMGRKRIEKATDRSIQWLQNHMNLRDLRAGGLINSERGRLFASLLPLSCANQQSLIDHLIEAGVDSVSGLALYDPISLADMPTALLPLPRLGFTEPSSPLQLLRHIASGLDILTVPFVNATTDAGIALDFSFPPSVAHMHGGHAPSAALGIDMWSPGHATDLSPLTQDCRCYACTTHHRAYVQHLLAAKEMLGWVLLQVHNHHILDAFFQGIRSSIAVGTFDRDVYAFERAYESTLPAKTGQGPRVRGYQFKSEKPGESKKNALAFKAFNQVPGQSVEVALPDPDADGAELEQQGFGERT